ncbi:hypothetical protein GCM10023334_076390 [Nonomuraea thailandensis]
MQHAAEGPSDCSPSVEAEDLGQQVEAAQHRASHITGGLHLLPPVVLCRQRLKPRLARLRFRGNGGTAGIVQVGAAFRIAVPVMAGGPLLLPEYRGTTAGRPDLVSVVLVGSTSPEKPGPPKPCPKRAPNWA